MVAVTRTEVVHGPVVLTFEGGATWTHETTITYVDDWIETAFGRMNCGRVLMSPPRLVPIERGKP